MTHSVFMDDDFSDTSVEEEVAVEQDPETVAGEIRNAHFFKYYNSVV